MRSDLPEVSVITPARNAGRTLSQAVGSVLDQTFPDWELLVVDDGSTDDTAAIVADHAAKDDRVVALAGPRRGVSAARNVGLAAARGRRVLFLDADDWIDREFMALMLAALETDPSAVAAYCGRARVMIDGSHEPYPADPAVARNPFAEFARSCAVAIHAVLADRAAVVALGGFDEGLGTCEDWDLWQRLARTGRPWVRREEILAFYRTTPGSLSRNVRQLLADARVVIDRGAVATEGSGAADPEARRAAETAFAYLALWCAAVARATDTPDSVPSDLLHAVPTRPENARSFATTVVDGLSVGLSAGRSTLAARWSEYGPAVSDLVASIGDPVAARRHQYAVERLILEYDSLERPRPLRLTSGARLEVERLAPLGPADSIDRLYLHFAADGKVLSIRDVGVLGPLGVDDLARLAPKLPDGRAAEAARVDGRTRLVALGIGAVKGLRRPSRLRSREERMRVRTEALRRARRELTPRRERLARHGAVLEALRRSIDAEISAAGRPDAAERVISGRDLPDLAKDRRAFWETYFSEPDPWSYGSGYEQEKYRRTLDLLPAGPLRAGLELACGEGWFTVHFAKRVDELIAADISATALERAAERCRGVGPIEFRRLDLVTDTYPGDRDVIVCSEVLYFLARDELPRVARRLADALRPGGALVTAHAYVLGEDPSRTAFDWPQAFGAATISRVLAATEGLVLEETLETELYRIDRFRRLPAPVMEPVTRSEPVTGAIEPEVARHIVRGGAVARRAEVAVTEQRERMPVLMYHRIASDGPEELARYRVTPDSFAGQMGWLRRHGYHAIMSEQLAWFVDHRHPFPGRPVMITFDDGYQDFEDAAWPILRAHDLSAEVFLVSELAGGPARWDGGAAGAPLMAGDSIRRLAAAGVFFGSHLATHRAADGLSTRELADELLRSRARIATWTGAPPKSLAAPYGVTDGRMRQLAHECGYQTLFSTTDGPAALTTNLLDIPRIEVRGDWTLADFEARLSALL